MRETWSLKMPVCPLAYLNRPDLWDKMKKEKKLPQEFKDSFYAKYPEIKEAQFGVHMMSDGTCEGEAFANGLEYRNSGGVWTCGGGAAIAKEIYGKRLYLEEV